MSLSGDDESCRISRFGDVILLKGHEIADKYVIDSVIGEGSTSIVYAAHKRTASEGPTRSPEAEELPISDSDPSPGSKLVAIKIIHERLSKNAQVVGRFQREVAIMKRLSGPHIVRVHEALKKGSMLALVLEHVDGIPFDRVLLEKKPLDVKTAVEVALQVCAGLGTAHAAGVVHRDLKPANMLYSKLDDEGRFHIKVADFGLAKVVHGEKSTSALTEHDMIFGTPEYMAPEQARGDEADARADIYALGCVLYEMLTGEVPFHESSAVVTMTAHLSKEPVPPRSRRKDGALSAALETVVLRALSKDPNDRYASARELAHALTAATASMSVVASPENADALGDTDLNVGELAVSATLPPDELPARTRGGAAHAPLSEEDLPAPSDTLPFSALALARSGKGRSRWVWIAIAVAAAVASIVIGVLVGTQ